MKTFTKKEIVILIIAIIVIGGAIWGGIKMLEEQPEIPVANEEVGVIDELELLIIDKVVSVDGRIRDINPEEGYLIMSLTWVCPRLLGARLVEVDEELRINVIPGETRFARIIEPLMPGELLGIPLEEIPPGLILPEPEEIEIKINELIAREMISVEGEWNPKKDILEAFNIWILPEIEPGL